MTYSTYEAAYAAVEAGMRDVEADFGPEATDDFSIYYDVVTNIALDCTPEIASELKRRELGLSA